MPRWTLGGRRVHLEHRDLVRRVRRDQQHVGYVAVEDVVGLAPQPPAARRVRLGLAPGLSRVPVPGLAGPGQGGDRGSASQRGQQPPGGLTAGLQQHRGGQHRRAEHRDRGQHPAEFRHHDLDVGQAGPGPAVALRHQQAGHAGLAAQPPPERLVVALAALAPGPAPAWLPAPASAWLSSSPRTESRSNRCSPVRVKPVTGPPQPAPGLSLGSAPIPARQVVVCTHTFRRWRGRYGWCGRRRRWRGCCGWCGRRGRRSRRPGSGYGARPGCPRRCPGPGPWSARGAGRVPGCSRSRRGPGARPGRPGGPRRWRRPWRPRCPWPRWRGSRSGSAAAAPATRGRANSSAMATSARRCLTAWNDPIGRPNWARCRACWTLSSSRARPAPSSWAAQASVPASAARPAAAVTAGP